MLPELRFDDSRLQSLPNLLKYVVEISKLKLKNETAWLTTCERDLAKIQELVKSKLTTFPAVEEKQRNTISSLIERKICEIKDEKKKIEELDLVDNLLETLKATDSAETPETVSTSTDQKISEIVPFPKTEEFSTDTITIIKKPVFQNKEEQRAYEFQEVVEKFTSLLNKFDSPKENKLKIKEKILQLIDNEVDEFKKYSLQQNKQLAGLFDRLSRQLFQLYANTEQADFKKIKNFQDQVEKLIKDEKEKENRASIAPIITVTINPSERIQWLKEASSQPNPDGNTIEQALLHEKQLFDPEDKIACFVPLFKIYLAVKNNTNLDHELLFAPAVQEVRDQIKELPQQLRSLILKFYPKELRENRPVLLVTSVLGDTFSALQEKYQVMSYLDRPFFLTLLPKFITGQENQYGFFAVNELQEAVEGIRNKIKEITDDLEQEKSTILQSEWLEQEELPHADYQELMKTLKKLEDAKITEQKEPLNTEDTNSNPNQLDSPENTPILQTQKKLTEAIQMRIGELLPELLRKGETLIPISGIIGEAANDLGKQVHTLSPDDQMAFLSSLPSRLTPDENALPGILRIQDRLEEMLAVINNTSDASLLQRFHEELAKNLTEAEKKKYDDEFKSRIQLKNPKVSAQDSFSEAKRTRDNDLLNKIFSARGQPMQAPLLAELGINQDPLSAIQPRNMQNELMIPLAYQPHHESYISPKSRYLPPNDFEEMKKALNSVYGKIRSGLIRKKEVKKNLKEILIKFAEINWKTYTEEQIAYLHDTWELFGDLVHINQYDPDYDDLEPSANMKEKMSVEVSDKNQNAWVALQKIYQEILDLMDKELENKDRKILENPEFQDEARILQNGNERSTAEDYILIFAPLLKKWPQLSLCEQAFLHRLVHELESFFVMDPLLNRFVNSLDKYDLGYFLYQIQTQLENTPNKHFIQIKTLKTLQHVMEKFYAEEDSFSKDQDPLLLPNSKVRLNESMSLHTFKGIKLRLLTEEEKKLTEQEQEILTEGRTKHLHEAIAAFIKRRAQGEGKPFKKMLAKFHPDTNQSELAKKWAKDNEYGAFTAEEAMKVYTYMNQVWEATKKTNVKNLYESSLANMY